MNSAQPFLSIIIPVYNESQRIQNLHVIDQYLHQQDFTSELIVVNDGSMDDTFQKLDSTSLRSSFKVMSHKHNRGKGYAIKIGMLAAQGEFRLFTDADLSTPLKEFNKFLPYTKDYDVIIASRKLKGAHLLQRQSAIRESLGKGFTYLSQIILRLSISDFTCGFKCFSKSAAEKIFPRMTIDRWGFDSEILYIAKRKGLSVKEIPVIWSNDPHTKVKFPHDLIRSFVDLIEIRLNDLRKIYD